MKVYYIQLKIAEKYMLLLCVESIVTHTHTSHQLSFDSVLVGAEEALVVGVA